MRTVSKVLVIVALLAACSPSSDSTTTSSPPTTVAEVTTTIPTPTTTEAPSPTTTSGPTTTAAPTADVIVSGDVVDSPGTIEVTMGDDVEVRVLADVADEVHVHGYDLTFPTEPGVVTLVDFTADVQGIFEVELENAGIPLFDLVVNP